LFWGIPQCLHYLGWAAHRRGEYERAAALQEEALARCRQMNIRYATVWFLASLGCVLQAQGDHLRVAAYLQEALVLGREIDARGVLADAVEGTAWFAAAQGQVTWAAHLGGAAEALREALGAALHPVLHAGHEQAVQAMRAALGEAACAAAWAEGQALSLEEAVALALENPDTVRHDH
jgi:hypothetical protein